MGLDGGAREIYFAGNAKNPFAITSLRRFTHVRLNIYPDGGIARMRVYGMALPEWRRSGPEIDLAAAECGAAIVEASDKFYGQPQNLIMPGAARDMRDGWETRRRRGPGHDWVTQRLAAEGLLDHIEVDTSYFKGNYPGRCSLDLSDTAAHGSWREILPPTKLEADTRHIFREELAPPLPARFARFHIYPDGGVSRLRLFGQLTQAGRIDTGLAALNAAEDEAARRNLLRCCGSRTWAVQMAAARPFSTFTEFAQTADRIWAACAVPDQLEAFGAHPRIGECSGANYKTAEQQFDSIWQEVRQALLEVFAAHDSQGVQHTLYAMGEAVLEEFDAIQEIRLSMPNRHRLPVDLTPFGLDNPNEVFVPIDQPFGLIEATLTR